MSDQGFKWAPLGGGMLDQIICDCGWESQTYFDGQEYAFHEWERHCKAEHSAAQPPPAIEQ